MKLKIYIIMFTLLIKFSLLYSETGIVSSTFLTQDLEKPSATTFILTNIEIQKLGITKISQLLEYANGIVLQKVTPTSLDYNAPGFPTLGTKFPPTLMIDGMEVSEPILNRTFINNLPLSIDMIDRVEIILDPTTSRSGYNTTTGIINIVTKQPENLRNNISVSKGNRDMTSGSFSITKYSKILDSFIRADISHNALPKFKNHIQSETSSIKISTSKYTKTKRIYFGLTYMKTKTNFVERYIAGTPFGIRSFKFHVNLRDTNYYTGLFDLKSRNFDTSIYSYYFHGISSSINESVSNWYIRNSTRYLYKWNKYISFFTGYNISYTKFQLDGLHKLSESRWDVFLKPIISFRNYTLEVYTNIHKTTNFKPRFTYKVRLKRTFKEIHKFTLGYSYNTEEIPLLARKFEGLLPSNPSVFGNNVPVPIKQIKVESSDLHPFKFRISTFSYQYKHKFSFYYFYNLIYNLPAVYIYPSSLFTIILKTKSRVNINTYGFLTTYKFNFWKTQNEVSYLDQQVKDKTHNCKDTMTIYRRKYQLKTSINLTKNLVNSWIISKYSKLKFLWGTNPQRTIVDTSFIYTRNHMKFLFHICNLFNEGKKSSSFGYKYGRLYELKISYLF